MQVTQGVVIAQRPSGTAGGSAPGQFSIGGQRTDANSFTVDGVSANFGVSSNGLYIWERRGRVRHRLSAHWVGQVASFQSRPCGSSTSICAGVRQDTRRPGHIDDAVWNELLSWRGLRLLPQRSKGRERLVRQPCRQAARRRTAQRFRRVSGGAVSAEEDVFLLLLRGSATASAADGRGRGAVSQPGELQRTALSCAVVQGRSEAERFSVGSDVYGRVHWKLR